MDTMIETVQLGSGTAMGQNVVHLVMQAGPLAKIVLLILLLFSLGAWGIILDKWLQFNRLHSSSKQFMRLFKQSRHMGDLADRLKQLKPGPLVRIFIAGYRQLERRTGDIPGEPVFVPVHAHRLEMALDDAILVELQVLERRIAFLGTCAGVTPFIGLFGTVWGLLTAFSRISLAGSASIAAVAPGIAEALITTAAGLAAAIPAVMAYNYFLRNLRSAHQMFERFRSSFLAAME
ncbi:MotA/TolQ/ExbB proton channel family protein [bacterium]|nr:MotA/TolQ/ExbB proton channel family protein [candidate division CSSED10-310 bacterium]